MNRRAFVALAAAAVLPVPPTARGTPPDEDEWPGADPASWHGYHRVGGSAGVCALVLTWPHHGPPWCRIDFLDEGAPSVPGVTLPGPLDASGLQIVSHVPYGSGFFPEDPDDPGRTSVVIDFAVLADVSVLATSAPRRGIAIVARPTWAGRAAPAPGLPGAGHP